jgi:Tfp pilus assembly protein PilN
VKQQINFYRGQAAVPQDPLSPRSFGLMTLALLLVLGAASGLQAYAMHALQRQLVATEQRASAFTAHLKVLEAEHPQRKADPALLAEADLLQRRHNEMQSMLGSVLQDERSTRSGFAEFLQGLARRMAPDVWLTQIRIQAAGRGIELQGNSLHSESIPKLVQNLGEELAFREFSFADLIIRRAEQQNQVGFTLRSDGFEKEKNGRP